MRLDTIRAYAPTFLEATQGMRYIRRGVFWSELLALCAIAKQAGAYYALESGTGLGFSANVLARNFEQVSTFGLEEQPAELSWRVNFYDEDSTKRMPSMVDEKTVVLIDGPKHEAGVELAKACSAHGPAVIAMHDCPRGSIARDLFVKAFPQAWFTDDPAFVAEFGHLDRECLDMAASRGKTFPDHGPTLGIVVL